MISLFHPHLPVDPDTHKHRETDNGILPVGEHGAKTATLNKSRLKVASQLIRFEESCLTKGILYFKAWYLFLNFHQETKFNYFVAEVFV